MKYVTIINNEQYEVEINKDGQILVNGVAREVDFLDLGQDLFSIITNNRSMQAVITQTSHQSNIDVMLDNRMYEAQVFDERALLMANRKGGLMGSNSGEVHAPMPGLIVKVVAELDQVIEANHTVVILESMKMQNELKAPITGILRAIHCEAGKTVDKGELLLLIVPLEAEE